MKAIAEKTMMITITNKEMQQITDTVPIFDISFEMDKETVVLMLRKKPIPGLKLGDRVNLSITATTDPTPKNAEQAVSLGYFMHRWTFGSCELIREDPPTFVGWRVLYNTFNLEEQWDYARDPEGNLCP